jgi:hypothetical protein
MLAVRSLRRTSDQQRPPRNERAQDQVADLLVGCDHATQLVDVEDDHLAVLRGDSRQVRRLPRQEIRSAPEAATSDHTDQPLRLKAVIRVARE